MNDDCESADKEVQDILNKNDKINSLKCKKPKKMYKIKNDLIIPKIETNVLSKKTMTEFQQHKSLVLNFIKTENYMRETQEMKVKKKKILYKNGIIQTF